MRVPALLCLTVLSSLAVRDLQAENAPRPHILWFVVDDMSAHFEKNIALMKAWAKEGK